MATTINPEVRTTVAIEKKDEARRVLEKQLRAAIREHLTYNSAVTDADRKLLKLPIHKTSRTPVPDPTTYPDFDVDSSVIRHLSINFYDQGSKSKAKPFGVHGAEIKWGIDTLTANPDELPNSSFDTKTPFTLEFKGDERGKTVYFCLCWENTTGKKGPWSEIVSAIIP
jgi:hypothetical protein